MPASSIIERFWLISVALDPFEENSLVIMGCLFIACVNTLFGVGLTGELGHCATHYTNYCYK